MTPTSVLLIIMIAVAAVFAFWAAMAIFTVFGMLIQFAIVIVYRAARWMIRGSGKAHREGVGEDGVEVRSAESYHAVRRRDS